MQEIKDIATKAGEILLKYYKEGFSADTKSDGSLITQADKDADEFIKQELLRLYPHDQIITEESLIQPQIDANIWYIDPLDGTKDFVSKSGNFSVIIGRHTPLSRSDVGLIYFPLTNEYMYSSKEGVVYESLAEKRLLNTTFKGNIFYKENISTCEYTKKFIENIDDSGKIAIRPSGYAMKEFLLNDGKMMMLGQGYLYELCAFEALMISAGGILSDLEGNLLNFYATEPKVTGGLVMGSSHYINSVS